MSDALIVEADATSVLKALDDVGEQAGPRMKAAALISAEHIRDEALRRVARRTGHTASGITLEEGHRITGYVVYVRGIDQRNLPIWLEYGTVKMRARPFLWVSAGLEQDAHERRMRDALQTVIDDVGLGE